METKIKKPLLSLTRKDFRVDTFCAGGKGGQHQNKTHSAIRITHIETGFSAECRNYRSQYQNKKEAFIRLCNNPRFRFWIKNKSFNILNMADVIEKQVREAMLSQNLKIEVRKNNGWITLN
jgi:hypothetical protein